MPYQFRGQHRNEEVLLLSRQHPFVLLRPFLIAGFILLIPLIVDIFVSFGPVLSTTIVICLLVGLIYGFLTWVSWNNSLLLLTTERVVQLKQHSIFNREFVECDLPNIQQVSHEVKGVMPTLWGYGTISVATGSSAEPILIKDMPDPYDIQQEIQRAVAGEAVEE